MKPSDQFTALSQLYVVGKEYPLLSAEEERELFGYIARTNDAGAKNRAVCHNVRLVMSVAKDWTGNGVELEDLVQEGLLGLVRAIEDFDLAHKSKFSTYAMWWIRRFVIKAIIVHGKTIRLPSGPQAAQRKLRQVIDAMMHADGRQPTAEEIAVRVGKDPVWVHRQMIELNCFTSSLDLQAADDKRDSSSATRLVSREISPETMLRAREELEVARERIEKTLRYLEGLSISDRDKAIFKLYYMGDVDAPKKTLQSLGAQFGITKEGVRQICTRVWKQLTSAGSPFDADSFMAERRRIKEIEEILNQ